MKFWYLRMVFFISTSLWCVFALIKIQHLPYAYYAGILASVFIWLQIVLFIYDAINRKANQKNKIFWLGILIIPHVITYLIFSSVYTLVVFILNGIYLRYRRKAIEKKYKSY